MQFLSREGHVAHWVDNGLEAWQRLSARLDRFHLLITDHQMPELNGIALVERLRSVEYRGGIIVYSSPLRAADRLRYQELQVDRVVEKSASPAELLFAVRSVLPA